ncbi:tudor domain-containing protein 5-like [Cydia pomonella]|uniref:tudor domain-containing protein 5-like n=1 Tax=Cydia pomonella TaxID=82600 RepID=UPI002ADDA552|nr:tudor domain-containing protein 5-like [Cydia pomonella]
MADLEGLKKVLRSLVVSSATTMDAASLLRDYRRMLGEPLPSAKHGFRDPVQFLRERCSDCFLFAGPQNNPILTLIVTDSIKHIDQFVQSQKSSKLGRGKRRSVPESIIKKPQPSLIATTFNKEATKIPNGRPITTSNRGYTEREPPTEPRKPEPKARFTEPWKLEPIPQYSEPRKPEPAPQVTKPVSITTTPSAKKAESVAPSAKVETLSNGHSEHEEGDSHQRLQRFLKKRMPVYQSQKLGSKESLQDDDSGRQTSSSLSERSATAWANLQAEILRLVARRPEGLWCSELLRLYEEEYGHELNFARFRYPSVSACACAVEGLSAQRAADGNWLLTVQGGQTPGPRRAPALRLRRAARDASLGASRRSSRTLLDADDALPGIDYDPDVFPSDCLSFLESIPAGSLAGVAPGDMLPVVVAEVYSPSHLWLQRLGPEHDLMQEHMDQMTEYYTKGEGVERVLAAGARRPGQYCSSVFEGDWHRSLIVQVVDSDTVKVRHVDYGTVDTVAASSLRPLRRQWASPGAQAVRARLAGLRPAAASRRWPRAAAAHCLQLVRERRLVANVVAADHEESILEVFLIDTSTDEDVNISEQMIRAGHADARPLPALGARDGYLLPTFHALETGLTPNYSEIHALLRDGIALDFVDSYRNHVAALLPTSSDDSSEPAERAEADGALESDEPSSPPPSPPPPLAANRVPMALSLLRLAPSPPTEELLGLGPVPSPVPNSTPAASPREQSAELDSPVPEIQERCMTPVTSAPEPPAAPAPPAPAPALAPAPAPAPAKPCCANSCCPAPHPASFYALPYCPCTQAYKPQVQVPVSVPMVRHYAPGYFRPRVSPQQYYPQFRPPVSMNCYAGQPVFHQAHQNFPAAQQPQSFVPNSAQNPHQFVLNSMHNPQHFVSNSTQNFRPYPGPNPHPVPQNFRPGPVTNSPNFGPCPAPNSPNFGPTPSPNPSNFGPSPMPNSPNFRTSPVPNPSIVGPAPNSASSPNLQLASPARNGPQPANFGPGPLRASSNTLNGDGPSVRLGAEECEIFELLSRVDPGAAHRYMIAALRRARGGPDRPRGPDRPPGLNPHAAEFRAQPDCRPPPGFENCTK